MTSRATSPSTHRVQTSRVSHESPNVRGSPPLVLVGRITIIVAQARGRRIRALLSTRATMAPKAMQVRPVRDSPGGCRTAPELTARPAVSVVVVPGKSHSSSAKPNDRGRVACPRSPSLSQPSASTPSPSHALAAPLRLSRRTETARPARVAPGGGTHASLQCLVLIPLFCP